MEAEGRGLKTRLLIPQEVCKRHARVTPNPSQHTQRRLHTHTRTVYTHTRTTHKQHRLEPRGLLMKGEGKEVAGVKGSLEERGGGRRVRWD